MVKHENDTPTNGGLDEYESRSSLTTRTIADIAAVRFILVIRAIFAPRAYALSAPSPALRSVWASATVSRLTPLL